MTTLNQWPFPGTFHPIFTEKHMTPYREELLNQALREGVGIVHIFHTHDAMGGMTVAFKKANEFESGTMVEVAVASCSKLDPFSKKVGTEQALEKYFDGETIMLPLLNHYHGRDIAFAVKRKFTALWLS